MEKFVDSNGFVALLVSENYGNGWWTDHRVDALLWSPKIVDWVLRGKPEDEDDSLFEHLSWHLSSDGGEVDDELVESCLDTLHRDVVVEWIPAGTEFVIDTYDGQESVLTEEDFVWHLA
jgi:hypothetical protein